MKKVFMKLADFEKRFGIDVGIKIWNDETGHLEFHSSSLKEVIHFAHFPNIKTFLNFDVDFYYEQQINKEHL